MKKTVVVALAAAAFVMGTGATTSAAANPFSDVPQGHWAYNSVSKLAAEGVIEGYGDGTYRGDRNITRYEMAQMIAKAMAKNPTGANKAELDRLAAEFRDELDALGVRVAELEKYADKVVWHGELRYRYKNTRIKTEDGGKIKNTRNWILMRFEPTATVNDHWKLKARLDATSDMKDDTSSDFKLKQAYAQGTYGNFQINVGKLPFYTNVDDGMLIDDEFSGAQIVYGDKFKVALMAGRWSGTNDVDTASYQGGELSYDNDKLYIGAGFHHFRSDYFTLLFGQSAHITTSATCRFAARMLRTPKQKIGKSPGLLVLPMATRISRNEALGILARIIATSHRSSAWLRLMTLLTRDQKVSSSP